MGALLKPSELFRTEIEPALAEYRADHLSERRAKYVARAIDHHLDWTHAYYKSVDRSRAPHKLWDFRLEVFERCPELQIMNDLSNAAHHRLLRVREKLPRLVATASDAFTVCTDELWIEGYGPFLPAANAAVEFWRKWRD